uniref:Mitochondrial protein n=1 Tax=Solanum lycopersicum TaxID=4081 RepID=A0A3Q7I282_SOLLC
MMTIHLNIHNAMESWLNRPLCYLNGVPGLGILYRNHGHSHIEYFADANSAGSKIDRRSSTSYCVFVGGNLVSWKRNRSSAEFEYK